MIPPKVLVVRPIPPVGIEMLRDHGCEVVITGQDQALTAAELCATAKGMDAVISFPSNAFDQAFFAATAPELKIVSNYGVGIDHIDQKAAQQFGVRVTNTPGVLTQATAEMAWALLFASARRVVEADQFVRAGKWKGPDALTLRGVSLSGKTLGVWGVGQIGEAFARMSAGFKMRLHYVHPRPHPELERDLGATRVDPETLLRESDFLSLHVPLNAQTRHLIGAAELALMKPSAILINAARGAIVNEAALTEALIQGRPGAAGLDVFEREPVVTPELLTLPQVVLAPHLGSGTREARDRMAVMAAEHIVRHFAET